jgi:hypothetical protein
LSDSLESSNYTNKQQIKKKKKQEVQLRLIISEPEEDEYLDLKESKVSKRLSDLTTKRVIIIVLSLLLIMPLFSADYYSDPPVCLDYFIPAIKEASEK